MDSRAVEEFNRQLSDRYEIRQPLGSGGFGSAYLASDKWRQIDVCVKVYRQPGPLRIERDWYITSVLKSDFLADTFNIEVFRDELGQQRIAAVSRFIPGVNLDGFLSAFEEQPAEQQREQRHIILRDLGMELCNAVLFCADNGHVHGDLHERNVIVTHPFPSGRSRFGVVLIDFDNKSSVPADSEWRTTGDDVTAVRRILFRMIQGARASRATQGFLQIAADCRSLKSAFQESLTLFGDSLEDDIGGAEHAFDWNYLVRRIALHRSLGGHGRQLANALLDEFIIIAREVGAEVALNDEYETMQRSDPDEILDFRVPGVSVVSTPSWMGRILAESPQGSSPSRARRGTVFSIGINESTLKKRRE